MTSPMPSQPRRTHRILRWTVRVLVGLIALIVLLVAGGATYEAIMAAGDDTRYPAPGQRVDVGGYRLHVHCVGEGNPTVVLDAGLGGFSLDWSLVQPELAATTRVCAYDRAGYGWSDPSPHARTPSQIADELHTLLVNAGIQGPYVLVGHSAAGKHVRLFASRYPQAVVGMVLVDARHESVDTNRSPEALAGEHTQQRRFQRTISAAARIGLVRAFWAAAWPQVFPATQNLSTETRAEIGVLQARSGQVKTVLKEDALLTHDNAQLSSAPSLGDVPLMVLAAGQNVEHDPLWLPAQQQLAGLSSNAKLIVVEGSSHYIHWDQPMLVAGAIRQVVEAARTDQH
ncbi:MAG TPA: alpha/beta hydrolase [Propionibacteriaceae bacterium]|nr:alpha/beta hydrolase [Propionibacteriaceae bacterium]